MSRADKSGPDTDRGSPDAWITLSGMVIAIVALIVAVAGANVDIRRRALLATFAAVALITLGIVSTLLASRQAPGQHATSFLGRIMLFVVLGLAGWTSLAVWGSDDETPPIGVTIETSGSALVERGTRDELVLLGVGSPTAASGEFAVFAEIRDDFAGKTPVAITSFYEDIDRLSREDELARWSGNEEWLAALLETLSQVESTDVLDVVTIVRVTYVVGDGRARSDLFHFSSSGVVQASEGSDDLGIECFDWHKQMVASGVFLSAADPPTLERISDALIGTMTRLETRGDEGIEACDSLSVPVRTSSPERDSDTAWVELLGLIVGVILLVAGIKRIEIAAHWKTVLSLLDVVLLVIGTIRLGWLGLAIVLLTNLAALVVSSLRLAIKKQSILTYAATQASVSLREMELLHDQLRELNGFRSIGPIQTSELISTLSQCARSPSEVRSMAEPIAMLHVVHGSDLTEFATKFDQLLRRYGEPAEEAMRMADQLTVATKQSAATFDEIVEAMLAVAKP